MIRLLLAAGAVLGQLVSNINALTLDIAEDPVMIQNCMKASACGLANGCDAREMYLKVPVDDDELACLLSIQREDGSFSDIDYENEDRGAWKTSLHCYRVARLAIRSVRQSDHVAGECCLKAMDFWLDHTPVCPNWWHNEIGVPRLLGPAFLLMKDELDPERLRKAVTVMSKAKLRATGQNKVWLAGNVLVRALLQEDEILAMQARDSIASELHKADIGEGLRPDWSFHQHGPQLQFGNYGLSYAVSLSWWAAAFQGTSFAFSDEQMRILKNFTVKGLGQVVHNGWFDHNACARQVFRTSQMDKALSVSQVASNLGIRLPDSPGAVYYPYSDFGVYRGADGWYASIRMQSERIKGYENTNNENKKGYFSSDGALLVRVSGDEYYDISPVWNWRHIPGATTYDDGRPLPVKFSPNNSAEVSGKVRGKTMTASMRLNRDGLKALKTWTFNRKFIICRGEGISMDSDYEVITTIEQNLLSGEVLSGDHWVWHRNILYVSLDDNRILSDTGEHSGTWLSICQGESPDTVTADVFDIYISHGIRPRNASYSYAVVPGIASSKAARMASRLRRRF